MIGAGPLSDRTDLIRRAAGAGAGAVFIKQTAWTEPKPGVRKMYAERGGYFFNPSDRRLNSEQAGRLIGELRDNTDIPLIVNILGDGAHVDTWTELGYRMQKAGAHAVELNFACPNPPANTAEQGGDFEYGATMSRSPALAAKIIRALSDALSIPVFMKFSGDGVDVGRLVCAADEAGASGVTAFFSPRGAFPIDIYRRGQPRLADLTRCSFGGVNGPAIRAMSNRIVAETAMAAPGMTVIGGGGISNWRHVVETVMFGASLCFVFTEAMLNGFGVVTAMNEGLQSFMESEGYETIADMRGLTLDCIVPNSELDWRIGPPAKVDVELCNGCGLCERLAFCRAITLSGKKAFVDAAKCECCGLCASVCPRSAIRF